MTSKILAVQHNGIPDEELQVTRNACINSEIGMTWFGVTPFSHELTFPKPQDIEQADKVLLRGSTIAVQEWVKGAFPKNVVAFYDEKAFDQYVYSAYLGDELLNADARYYPLGNVLSFFWPGPVFVKPSRDLKAFEGFVLNPGVTLGLALSRMLTDSALSNDELVLVASIKEIISEYRCVVLNGQLVDASLYRHKGNLYRRQVTDPERWSLERYIKELDHIYSPSPVYVVDTAVMNSPAGPQMKVVEYTCFNAAGLYACDRALVFKTILDYI